ncbi:MAG: hypothetical protein A2Y38_21500 [Spirochaetes bacterium GWB1_59_5]|nr:MAG: hypothetical protein A2Y38_21500 [Spirochaetes bacterium GWB1_59_5]
MGIKGFFDKRGKHSRAATIVESARPDKPAPLASLEIDAPLDGLSAGFLFPLAFSVGSVPVRVRPLRLELNAEAGAGAETQPGSSAQSTGCPWFFWKAETPAGRLGGFWQLPGPSGDAAVLETWNKTASALASAAAPRLKETLASKSGLLPTAFTAGPCPAPALGNKPFFRADFRYAVRGGFREGSAYTSASYPVLLSKALGIYHQAMDYDPIGAIVACSKALLRETFEDAWAPRSFLFKDVGIERSYLPVYELFNMLSEQDLRLVIQNNIAAGAQSETLGSLFMYRSAVKTDAGISERLTPSHSLDRKRVDPLLPNTIFEDGRFDPVNAAPDLQAFLRRNDEAYEDLFRALRKDTLALSEDGAAIIRSIYVAMVYAPKRSAFDGFVSAREPMTQIREFSEHLARRAVDTSGAKALAAAVYGSKEDLDFITRWCSSRKRETIADELKRLDKALSEGLADLEAVVIDRFAILEKVKTIKKVEAD